MKKLPKKITPSGVFLEFFSFLLSLSLRFIYRMTRGQTINRYKRINSWDNLCIPLPFS